MVEYAQSKITLFILFALTIISLTLSAFLTLMFFFLFVGSLIYQVVTYSKIKKAKIIITEKVSDNLDSIDFHIDEE